MKKYFVFILLMFFIYFSASSQVKKIKFHSINSFGIADGESKAQVIFQSVNGFAYKNWYYGIGVGGDYYYYNSYPVFFDVRRYFGNHNNFFAYADLGYNASGRNKPGKEVYYYNTYHFSGDVYTDFGIGYRVKFTGSSALVISAGYSYKEINNKISYTDPCLVAPCAVDNNKYKYGNGRVVLKAGVDF